MDLVFWLCVLAVCVTVIGVFTWCAGMSKGYKRGRRDGWDAAISRSSLSGTDAISDIHEETKRDQTLLPV